MMFYSIFFHMITMTENVYSLLQVLIVCLQNLSYRYFVTGFNYSITYAQVYSQFYMSNILHFQSSWLLTKSLIVHCAMCKVGLCLTDLEINVFTCMYET